MNVVVVGSVGYDYIMNFSGSFTDRIMEDKIHSLSLSFLVDTLTKQFGGTAGNIAYSLNLLQTTPYILATAGNDFLPYKEFLESQHISTEYIKEYKDITTSSYFVVTDTANNQIGSFYTGAMRYSSKQLITDVKKNIDYAIISPTDPKTMIAMTAECQRHSIKYLYDPAFQIAVIKAEDLRTGINGCDILMGNDYEIHLIEERLEITHEDLIAMVPILITTLGNKGSIIESTKESIHIKPATPKKVVDPTGAGDSYRAGFIAGYLRGLPLNICGMMGSVASVYAIESFGTQRHTYSIEQFTKRFEQNFRMPLII